MKLKAYTQAVMETYAENFNKDLKSKDLVWYAKLEHNRSYKHSDREVQLGQKQKGQPKEGLNTHVQVIVSRKDAQNKKKLSPLSHHRGTKQGPVRGGFDRVNFKMKSIAKFDELFQYQRQVNELERYRVKKYGTEVEKEVYQQRQKTTQPAKNQKNIATRKASPKKNQKL